MQMHVARIRRFDEQHFPEPASLNVIRALKTCHIRRNSFNMELIGLKQQVSNGFE